MELHDQATALWQTVAVIVASLLNRGDEVPVGKAASETVLGKRRVIAGIEKSRIGMRAGGYRKVRISPHLACGDDGVAGAIPPAAVLCVELWLREILPP